MACSMISREGAGTSTSVVPQRGCAKNAPDKCKTTKRERVFSLNASSTYLRNKQIDLQALTSVEYEHSCSRLKSPTRCAKALYLSLSPSKGLARSIAMPTCLQSAFDPRLPRAPSLSLSLSPFFSPSLPPSQRHMRASILIAMNGQKPRAVVPLPPFQ